MNTRPGAYELPGCALALAWKHTKAAKAAKPKEGK